MARKKYIDKRNWPEYNEKLVHRGEQFFSIVIVDRQSEDAEAASQKGRNLKTSLCRISSNLDNMPTRT